MGGNVSLKDLQPDLLRQLRVHSERQLLKPKKRETKIRSEEAWRLRVEDSPNGPPTWKSKHFGVLNSRPGEGEDGSELK